MNLFKIKCIVAAVYDAMGISTKMLNKINKAQKNNYIRVLNYHHSPMEDRDQFIKQIKWLSEHFEFCGISELEMFLDGKKTFVNRPGMIITFDDGYLDNYEVAHKYLSQHNIPAVYMVSTGLIGRKAARDGIEAEYISCEQLKEMIKQGAEIGCHTYSHHRMNESDNDAILHHEIVEAKRDLENMLGHVIDIFCWCGGEENTYTKNASDIIRSAGFKFGFMTNSTPIMTDCDRFQIDRSNLEAGWPLSLVKFQLCGAIDKRLKDKRERVHTITK